MAKTKKKLERKKASMGHFDHDEIISMIGKRIRYLRKKNGFNSAERFSYEIEISRAGMSNYESGKFNDIQMSTLLKIIDGLDTTISEFFAEGFD